MPTGYVRKLANKHHKSVGSTEERWAKAKRLAAQQGHSGNYAYVTSIFKNMMHEKSLPTFKNFLILEADLETQAGKSVQLNPEENKDDVSDIDFEADVGERPPVNAPSPEDETGFTDDELAAGAEGDHPVDLENDERFLELKQDSDPKAQGLVRHIEKVAAEASPAEVEELLQVAWERLYGDKGVSMSGPDDMHHMGGATGEEDLAAAGPLPPLAATGESLMAGLLGLSEAEKCKECNKAPCKCCQECEAFPCKCVKEGVDDENVKSAEKKASKEAKSGKYSKGKSGNEKINWKKKVNEKWDEEAHIHHTGENTDKSVAELEKERSAAKRSGNTTKLRQKNFAIRAKTGWGKV